MEETMKKVLIIALYLFAFCFAQDREGWPDNLYFGLTPFEESGVKESWETFLNYIGEELGVEVSVFEGQDYSEVIVALAYKNIQAAWLGPKSYVTATKTSAVEAIALPDDVETGTGYYSGIWASKESGFTTVDELKDKTFAFVDPESTSGYFIPKINLVLNLGVQPEDYFSQITFTGSHIIALNTLIGGQVDGAAISFNTVERALKEGVISEGEVVNLWKSLLIPGSPIVVNSDLPSSFKQALQEAIINFDDQTILNNLGYKNFVVTDDSNYDNIRLLENTYETLR